MTIRRVTEQNPVLESEVGKWACPDSIIYDGICTKPWEITQVAKSRVYLRKVRRDRRDGMVEVEEKYVLSKTVKFVCDTEAEGDELVALSIAQMDEVRDSRRAVLEKYQIKIDAMIKARS